MYNVHASDQMVSSQSKFKQVASRLGVVILTNFLASMTVTIISILSHIIYIPASLEAMIAFLLFPANAMTNPLINTLTTSVVLKRISAVELPMILFSKVTAIAYHVVDHFYAVKSSR